VTGEKREILTRLRDVAEIERRAGAEVDRMFAIAWEAGATDKQIAAALGIRPDAARMRRRRSGLRGNDPGRRVETRAPRPQRRRV